MGRLSFPEIGYPSKGCTAPFLLTTDHRCIFQPGNQLGSPGGQGHTRRRLGWGWPAGMGLAGRTLTPRLCSEDNDWQMPSSFSNTQHTLNGWTPDSGSHSYSLSSQRAGTLSSEAGRYLPGKAELTGLLP